MVAETAEIYTDIGVILAAVLVIVLGVIVGMGKGDFLISGYNTASETKRESFNIIRLRMLTMSVCVVIGVLLMICAFVPSFYPAMTVISIIAAIADVVLMNTWAKRK